MLRYYEAECWFFNIDSRATDKTKLRPETYCMDSCEVVYKNILKRLTIENSIEEPHKAVCCCEAH